MMLINLFSILKAGRGRGNFGHRGRPGKRGGSSTTFGSVLSSLPQGELKDKLNQIVSHPKYTSGAYQLPKLISKPEVWEEAKSGCEGQARACHINSLKYAEENLNTNVVVGVLVDHNFNSFYHHVWVADKKGQAIEPTLGPKDKDYKRSYIGYPLPRSVLSDYQGDQDKLISDVNELMTKGTGNLVKYI